jgi:uncharacterized protein (DUF697 family)
MAVTATITTEEQIDSAASSIITKYSLWSLGAGLIPIPWMDMAAVAGVQLKMVSDLSKKYGVPFSDSQGKAIIGSLVGGIIPGQVSAGFVGGFAKMLPFVGFITVPAFAGASTYAVGKVFATHFASGGTFLTLDPEKVRKYFKEQFEKGKTVVGSFTSADVVA